MKFKLRKSDIIAIIIITIAVILIIKYVNSGQENREYLYQNGIEITWVVFDFTYSKSRRFVRYKYTILEDDYSWSYQFSEGDPALEVGDSIKILYDPNDYSNSTPFINENGNIVKIYKINREELDSLLKKLID